MTFPLDFDLLMIRVCTFIQGKKKKQKNKKKKKQKKKKQKKTKKKRKKRKKKEKKKRKKCKDMLVSHILLHRFLFCFVVGFINGGLSEIFMRDELCESSLRSFVPCSSNDRGEFYLFLMTFPLEFDLLMIGICTFIQGKKKKKTQKKQKKNKKTKQKQNKNKKKTKKKTKKKVQRHVYVSYLTPLGFCCWVHHWGLGEIFMRYELCESSLRSFVPWIMTDMYLI